MSIHRRITTVIAAIAALALATGGSWASARTFDQSTNGSFVPAVTVTSSSPAVPPILHKATASELAALAQAERQRVTYAPSPGARYSNAEINAYASTRPAASEIAGVSSAQIGFDWGDAGIGAAAGFVLAILGIGGAAAIYARRARRDRHSTALSS